MKHDDLTKEAVDNHPEREWSPAGAMAILPGRTGHLFDPWERLQAFGIDAEDSNGVHWDVYEDGDGVYKRRKECDLVHNPTPSHDNEQTEKVNT